MPIPLLKLYYPRLDLLKFLCCVGVVCIHTKPFFYCNEPISGIIQFLSGMSVPLFFMVSAYLFWGKISFVLKTDIAPLKNFISRLFILYITWSILIFPSWFIGFYHRYPEEWLYLLPFKLFVTGAPHGSWFIMSLIQGTLICYFLNKYLGKIFTTILCFAVTFYVNMVFHGMPDYLNVYYQYKEFNIWFSPFYAMLWIQLGCLVRIFYGRCVKRNLRGGVVFLGLFVTYMLKDVHYVSFVVGALFKCLVLFYCVVPLEMGRSWNFSMLRKMSVIIYFVHFVFTIIWRTLVERGNVSYEFGFREFFIVLLCSIIVSYVIVKMSDKFKLLKYLY